MRVAVPKEIKSGEKRVALVPDVINKISKLGFEINVESGAGIHAHATDQDYENAGAIISREVLSSADIVLSVQPLIPEQISTLKKGVVTLSFLSPAVANENIDALTERNATAFSMELIPRISRAQSMDALTSQALCSGYKAALVGAELSPRFFPLLMTAAGTITPAQVLVLGAGVAGLQAIATARRLGAVVSAYDVRASSADEVKSMGATFIDLELETLTGSGGYAREMSEDRALKQQELLTPHIAKSNVIITTAAVPGRPAPRMITKAMVDAMSPGSVIIDLASESGGNVEGSVAGETITTEGGVIIWGAKDVPSSISFHASSLYSRNLLNLLTLIATNEGEINIDFEDEIVSASVLTHNGTKRNE